MSIGNTTSVVIVDYGVGNLFSVRQACASVGVHASIVSDRASLERAQGVILPGVGAFGFAMARLRELDLVDALISKARSGVPFMGVCLGFQLLFQHSEEMGRTEGLGLLEGLVLPIADHCDSNRVQGKLRTPNVNWLAVKAPPEHHNPDSWSRSMMAGVKPGSNMYFVHSYFAAPTNRVDILAEANFAGLDFCVAVQRGNLFGCQFHPEKSGKDGLKIYEELARRLTGETSSISSRSPL